MKASLSINRHARLHAELVHAERLASYTLTAIRGRTASEVAAEVAARAIAALRDKRQPEAARREMAR